MKRKKSIVILEILGLISALVYKILLTFFNLKSINDVIFIILTIIIVLMCFGILLYEAIMFYQRNKRRKWLLIVGFITFLSLTGIMLLIFIAPWIEIQENVINIMFYLTGVSAFVCLIGQFYYSRATK